MSLELDLVKYRIEKAPYITIARLMRGMGCGDSNLKVLLKKAHGIVVFPGDNPDIYFVVTEETMKQIAQDMENNKSEGDARAHVILGLKIGTTTCMGLSEEQCKENWEQMIRRHNEL